MNSAETLQQRSPPPRMTWRTVLAAWHGITRVQVIATFLFGTAYFLYHAVVIWNAPHTVTWVMTHFVANEIDAFALMLCIVVADYVTGRDTRRRAAYALAVVVGAAVATPLVSLVTAVGHLEYLQQHPDMVLAYHVEKFLEWLILGGAATFVYTDWRSAHAARARMSAAELDRAYTAKRTLESRLQAMQARVEPQFLFNTLAQVRDLYRANAARGERMLDELIAYLRAAMPKMRDTSSTVGQEIELVRAYLAIVKVRLGDRFNFDIKQPGDLGAARMPPMMLLPLVDHAIAHGLAAPQATGSIRIRTVIADEKIRLEIADSGVGFLPENEADGIAGIRERLAALYGGAASLELHRLGEQATEAIVKIPVEAPSPLPD